MKKIFTVMLTLLFTMLLITSCATDAHQEGEEKSTTNSIDNVQDNKDSDEIGADNYKNIEFTCSYLQGSSKKYKETGFYFSDCEENEQAVNVSISANLNLNSFKIIELGFNDDNGEILYYNENTLFVLDSLPADTHFVINTVFIGTFPHRGIAFLDANNVEHIYALTTSGMDGSVYLFEITN